MLNVKKEGFKLLYGLIYLFCLIWAIRAFNIGFWGIYAILNVMAIIKDLFKHFFKDVTFSIKTTIKSAVIILLIMYIFKFLNRFGIWGFIIGVLGISALLLFRKWDHYIKVKQHIETMMWGKPLNEFKSGKDIPKLKFVVKK